MNERNVEHQLVQRLSAGQVGHYSLVTGVTEQRIPGSSGDPDPNITSVHEAIHRDLAVGSDLGLFERIIGLALSRRTDRTASIPIFASAAGILDKLVRSSWVAHESAATYCSVVGIVGADARAIDAYTATLPGDYVGAYRRFEDVLGARQDTAWDTVFVRQAAKCISLLALEVPILDAFDGFFSITDDGIARFLERHHPDRRHERILSALLQGRLVDRRLRPRAEECRALVEAADAGDDMVEVVRAGTIMDEHLMAELVTLFPDLCADRTINGITARRTRFLERIGPGLELAGLPRVDADVRHAVTTEHASQEVDELLDSVANSSSGQPTVMDRTPFRQVGALEFLEHAGIIREVGGGLFVQTFVNLAGDPLRVRGVDVPALHVALFSRPWQWGGDGDDRLALIDDKARADHRARASVTVVPFGAWADVAPELSTLPVVWLHSLDLREHAARRRLVYPPLPGVEIAFLPRTSSRAILERCASYAKVERSGFFLLGAPRREGAAADLFLVVAPGDSPARVCLFPVLPTACELLYERLTRIDNVRVWTADEARASGLDNVIVEVAELAIFHPRG